MHLSNPTVTVIIQSMIGKGLIVKEKDTEDRRKYILYVTEKGKNAFRSGRGESRAADDRVYEGLSRESTIRFCLGDRMEISHSEASFLGEFTSPWSRMCEVISAA